MLPNRQNDTLTSTLVYKHGRRDEDLKPVTELYKFESQPVYLRCSEMPRRPPPPLRY